MRTVALDIVSGWWDGSMDKVLTTKPDDLNSIVSVTEWKEKPDSYNAHTK